jgi:hypothetical protein
MSFMILNNIEGIEYNIIRATAEHFTHYAGA